MADTLVIPNLGVRLIPVKDWYGIHTRIGVIITLIPNLITCMVIIIPIKILSK